MVRVGAGSNTENLTRPNSLTRRNRPSWSKQDLNLCLLDTPHCPRYHFIQGLELQSHFSLGSANADAFSESLTGTD